MWLNAYIEIYSTTAPILTTNQTATPAQSFNKVRTQTEFLCESLETEDFVVQPIVDVSPLKWHLAHTTWFFEVFLLVPHLKEYELFHPKYPTLFNSYYISAGERWTRANRGQLTRPTVAEIFKYREYVSQAMDALLSQSLSSEMETLLQLGINHEQQHQELFLYDIKRILGDNPLMPVFRKDHEKYPVSSITSDWLSVDEGIYQVGHVGDSFHFDNEKGVHKVFLHAFEIQSHLVTNGEYKAFIEAGGYQQFQHWLAEAWDWINEEGLTCPRYWAKEGSEWFHYTLGGYEPVSDDDPVCHISYYEADAFAKWKGVRLPTEQEWETACKLYSPHVPEGSNFVEEKYFRPVPTQSHDFFGNLWEWTSSAYTPYPYYKIPEGAVGEYNGKFMVNQMVLRGGSFATPRNHIRATYRNFFHPNLRWLFSGFRLARHKA